MAGRRWAEGKRPANDPSRTPRPSERRDAGQANPGEGKHGGAAQKRPQPSAATMRRARQRLAPPPAPWHPLPLSELAIVLGAVFMILAVVLERDQGLIAGFVLILLGTAEFSWREHRHGYRSHGALLSGIIALPVAIVLWKAIGLPPKTSLLVGAVVFAIGWGILNSYYRDARAKRVATGG
ncbi:MAG: hypothetical protein PGN13_09175 [Patulibacter minatonensis]